MIQQHFKTEGASVMIWEITEPIEVLANMLSNFSMYKEEYEDLKTDKRRNEFLAVRIALNRLFEKEVVVRYDINGKPYISQNKSLISVSHSGKWIALMAHPEKCVGIDIEVPSDKVKKIYKRFLSKTEQHDLSDGTDEVQLQLAWSAKEALYKIIGKEAVDFAEHLRIFPFETGRYGKIEGEHLPRNKRYQLQYIYTREYVLVYCTE